MPWPSGDSSWCYPTRPRWGCLTRELESKVVLFGAFRREIRRNQVQPNHREFCAFPSVNHEPSLTHAAVSQSPELNAAKYQHGKALIWIHLEGLWEEDVSFSRTTWSYRGIQEYMSRSFTGRSTSSCGLPGPIRSPKKQQPAPCVPDVERRRRRSAWLVLRRSSNDLRRLGLAESVHRGWPWGP